MSRPIKSIEQLIAKYQDNAIIPFEVISINEEERTIVVTFEGDTITVNHEQIPVKRCMTYSYFLTMIRNIERKPAWYKKLLNKKRE